MNELVEALRLLRKALVQPAVSIGAILLLVGLGGFVALALAWRGAAATPYVPFQVPFLVSGGLVGLSLIGFAAAMLDIHVNRVQAARRRALMTLALRDAVDLLAAATEQQRGREAAAPAAADRAATRGRRARG